MAATECCSCLKYTWAGQHKYAHTITTISHLQLITTLIQRGNNSHFRNLQFDFLVLSTENTVCISKCRHIKVFWYFKWKNTDESIDTPIYLPLLLQRLKGCLPGFFPLKHENGMCTERQTWFYQQRRKNCGRTVPLWMKKWRAVTFMIPAKDWELGNLRGQ